jgi:hypothetical protein
MKIRLLSYIALVLVAAGGLMAFGGYPSGAPAAYTGSPGDGKNCVNCHGGSASNTSGTISTNIPASGYVHDSTYQITVSISGSGNKGFEVSPQNSTGTQLGTLIAGTNNHLTGGTKYVTQNSKVTSSTATWTFSWKAPASGSGDVTFYAAYTVSKPVTKLDNLTVHEDLSSPLGATASASATTINLGDSVQLNATATGGTGNYSYSWTSVPAGFTSSLQNPWAKPLITAAYTVQVSDGQSTVSSSVTVTVHNPQGIRSTENMIVETAPNPTHGDLRLSIIGALKGSAGVEVYNARGIRVIQSAVTLPLDQKDFRIDLSQQPCGVYYIRVSSRDAQVVKSVVRY